MELMITKAVGIKKGDLLVQVVGEEGIIVVGLVTESETGDDVVDRFQYITIRDLITGEVREEVYNHKHYRIHHVLRRTDES